MKQTINFTTPDLKEICGTSFHRGIVKGSAIEIEKVLGQCTRGWDEKTTFQWNRKYGSVAFSVYDYKEYPAENTVIEYHIGTKTPVDTGIIVGILKGLGFNAYIEK